MKILAIRTKNLASLEGLTEIDFTQEPLASAGIFAITGPTGAGKSTLLDALCLALYDKTPRYEQAKENKIQIQDVEGSTINQSDVRGILRDGTAEGFAEVDFEGVDRQIYRASWSVRRARNKVQGSMQSSTMALKNLTTEQEIPGSKPDTLRQIERIVGLSFEQFTRSVLLAQGDFTAFMKADKNEKSALLEKLTGTHIYSEISKKIFEKHKAEESALRDLRLLTSGIEILTNEELTLIDEELRVLNNQIKLQEEAIGVVNEEIHWHSQYQQLCNHKTEAENNLALAQNAVTAVASRKQKIAQITQIQATRSWHDAFEYHQQQQLELTAIATELKQKIAYFEKEKQRLEHLQNDAIQEMNLAKTAREEAEPLLAKAKELDTLLTEKNKQKNTSETQWQASQKALEALQEKHSSITTEMQKHGSMIAQIQQWQAKFQDKKSIAENKDVIVSKLTDAEKWVVSLSELSEEKRELEAKIELIVKQLDSEKKQLTVLENDWQEQQKTLNTLTKEVLLIPIERINVQKNETDLLVQKTLESQSIWKTLYHQQTAYKDLTQKQTEDKYKLSTLKNILLQLHQQLDLAKNAKETAEKMLQKAHLAAAENVQKLRETLVNEEPCPVCGSKEHPYTEHNPQLDKVLSTLEEEYKKSNENYLAQLQNQAKTLQESNNLEELIALQKSTLANQQENLQDHFNLWQDSDLYEETQNIDDAQKGDYLIEKHKTLKAKQSHLQAQITDYESQRKQIDHLKSKSEEVKEKFEVIQHNYIEYQKQREISEDQLNVKKLLIQQQNDALTEILKGLTSYFSSPDWTENWQKNPSDFVRSITTFSDEWNAKNNQYERLQTDYKLAINTLQQLETQLTQLTHEVSEKQIEFNKQQSEYLALEEIRRNIFNGNLINEIETELNNTLKGAQNNLEIINNTFNQVKIENATAQAKSETVDKNLAAISIEKEENLHKMNSWLEEYNSNNPLPLNLDDLKEMLKLSSEWIEIERKSISAYDEDLIKARSIVNERTQLLKNHLAKRLSDKDLETLYSLLEQSKTAFDLMKEQKSVFAFKLESHQNNQEKIADLAHKISLQAEITENWGKLNEVIGSADGKKFRQIAQEYTLEALLVYANIHLEMLTNRYKIQRIAGTLALQVIDLDMGEEIRTVYSLSGGESFLVSLALALGLASLSSNQMKVESLFIDEGFGSLDPKTLNIAMDALERLHNEGRKVGVISHVQEMTERIPVQINVTKKESGKSKVIITRI